MFRRLITTVALVACAGVYAFAQYYSRVAAQFPIQLVMAYVDSPNAGGAAL